MKTSIKFDLINNAEDSLSHAVEHLTGPKGPQDGDIKRAIRDVYHAIELILKERLRRVHPAFMWQDVDKYLSSTANTVSVLKAVDRLTKIAGISLAEEAKKTLMDCKAIRDSIEHYEFQINFKEAQGIIGRMLSFIFDFSKQHLQLDLENIFRKDGRWESLIDIYEFWEAHSAIIEKRLEQEEKVVLDCPSCGAATFDVEESVCLLCGCKEDLVECNSCHENVFLEKADCIELPDGSEYTICVECQKQQAYEE